VGLQRLAILVGEADPGDPVHGACFTAGHWYRRHRAIACSSRSIARWIGNWAV
jgi:hypothetical protein